MKTIEDYTGRKIRLTAERERHILGHPEMKTMLAGIKQTLLCPEIVVQSLSDSEANLYYRFYFGTYVGDKFLCVVAKIEAKDAFVLTAYLTDTVKKGVVLWPEK